MQSTARRRALHYGLLYNSMLWHCAAQISHYMEILAAKLEKYSLADGENFTLTKNPRQGESDGSAGEKCPSLLQIYKLSVHVCIQHTITSRNLQI